VFCNFAIIVIIIINTITIIIFDYKNSLCFVVADNVNAKVLVTFYIYMRLNVFRRYHTLACFLLSIRDFLSREIFSGRPIVRR